MAQSTPLAAGTTAANSSDIVVTAVPVTLSLFSGEADKRFERVKMPVNIKVGSDYQPYVQRQTNRGKRFPLYLTNVQRNCVLTEPGTYQVVRSLQLKSVGCMADTTA